MDRMEKKIQKIFNPQNGKNTRDTRPRQNKHHILNKKNVKECRRERHWL